MTACALPAKASSLQLSQHIRQAHAEKDLLDAWVAIPWLLGSTFKVDWQPEVATKMSELGSRVCHTLTKLVHIM
jgi:hypothetical protein